MNKSIHIITSAVAFLIFSNSVQAQSLLCSMRDGSTFTLEHIGKHILIDGKYKVFYKGTEDGIPPMYGDIHNVYKNKAYTYHTMFDDGVLWVNVKNIYGTEKTGSCTSINTN